MREWTRTDLNYLGALESYKAPPKPAKTGEKPQKLSALDGVARNPGTIYLKNARLAVGALACAELAATR